MKVAVRYYTKTGNTKRLAEAVAEAVGVQALTIETPVTEQVDILFLGNSYYAFTIDPEVRAFVQSLDKDKVGRIVNFGSARCSTRLTRRSRPWRTKLESLLMCASSTARASSRESTRADRMRMTSRTSRSSPAP